MELIIQGGAVGIAAGLIVLLGKVWDRHSRVTERVTEAVEKNATAMTGLMRSIDELTEAQRERREETMEHLRRRVNGLGG